MFADTVGQPPTFNELLRRLKWALWGGTVDDGKIRLLLEDRCVPASNNGGSIEFWHILVSGAARVQARMSSIRDRDQRLIDAIRKTKARKRYVNFVLNR